MAEGSDEKWESQKDPAPHHRIAREPVPKVDPGVPRHLDQQEQHQSQPPATRKTVTDDNIIAIATEPGPDRSAAGLLTTLTALKQFAKDLEEWHSEWQPSLHAAPRIATKDRFTNVTILF